MQDETKALALRGPSPTGEDLPAVLSPFSGIGAFEAAQRMAALLASSTLIPEAYRGEGAIGNCVVALELASRMRVSPLMLMQNMAVIEGRPALSSQYLIAMVNASLKFSPLRFRMRDLGQKSIDTFVWEGPRGARVKKAVKLTVANKGCIAWAKELATGETLEGPEVTIELAVLEGWFTRNGSKWQTMPDVMLTYRAAAFFSRMYAPEMALGMHTREEVDDLRTGSIEVETTAVDTPAPELPKRSTKSARGVVDVTPAPATDTAPATPPPATPPAPTAPTAPPTPGASGLPKRAPRTPPTTPEAKPAPAAPAAPSAPAETTPFLAWVKEHNVTIDEFRSVVGDYLGEEVEATSFEKVSREHQDFAINNADALASNIKGARI